MVSMDPFTKKSIQNQGFWVMSRCLDQERTIVQEIENRVRYHGYQRSADNHRLWTKGPLKVIICLVDDIRSASNDYETDMPYLFSRDTLVITDNYVASPSVYSIMNLPRSFFGIYSHTKIDPWQPDRLFSFSVNRIDDRRFRLMLELAKRTHLPEGYINFNCQDYSYDPRVPTTEELRECFSLRWPNLSSEDMTKYQSVYDMLEPLMPYKNYELDHEDMHYRSRCNMIVESYGSDTTAAFSEKIFRALQVPAPWTLYGGHYAVAYLESLGFDCMSDIINHNHYDQLKEIEDKARIFIWFSLKWARESLAQDVSQLEDRCRSAATHNQRMLAAYRQTWPQDFADWLVNLDRTLANRL